MVSRITALSSWRTTSRRILGAMLLRTFVILSFGAFLIMAADPSRIVVHGHRGARMKLPENTIPGFEYAIQAGANAIELDLQVSKDNVLIVSHDPTLHPPICTGPQPNAVIRQLTAAQLREWDCGATKNPGYPDQKTVPGTRLPTFDEVLKLAPKGNFDFNIEIKSYPERPEYTPAPDEYARMVWDRVRAHKLEKRAIVQSFDWRTLVALRKIAPDVRISALTDKDTREYTAIAKDAGNAQIVAPHYNLVTPEKVAAAHTAGLLVVPWTANTVDVWDRLIAAKVDGIITDDPAGVIAHLKARK
jgi:glycerophosphoryl diester phosphodiesterase